MATSFPATDDGAGRAVVVTGGGQGIGRQFCHHLARRGYLVVPADIDGQNAQAVADEVRAEGGAATSLQLDVADPDSCDRARQQLEGVVGAVHGLINNAAIFSTLTMKPFWEIPHEEWSAVVAVNLSGVFVVTKALLPLLRASESASVVNLSAAAVWFGRENYAHYVAAKAGVIGLSRAMARELGPDHIRVNTVTPGSVDTGIERDSVTPEQRQAITQKQILHQVLHAEDIAGTVAFLLGDGSRMMTGQALNVDGGFITR